MWGKGRRGRVVFTSFCFPFLPGLDVALITKTVVENMRNKAMVCLLLYGALYMC